MISVCKQREKVSGPEAAGELGELKAVPEKEGEYKPP